MRNGGGFPLDLALIVENLIHHLSVFALPLCPKQKGL
jgi:hypothetical protein